MYDLSPVEPRTHPGDILQRRCWWDLPGSLVKYHPVVQSIFYMKVSGCLKGPRCTKTTS